MSSKQPRRENGGATGRCSPDPDWQKKADLLRAPVPSIAAVAEHSLDVSRQLREHAQARGIILADLLAELVIEAWAARRARR